jgi:putative copper export protein
MIAIALVNRTWLAPLVPASAPALAALKATTATEIALGTVVVALVSVFALFDPA